MKKFISFIMAFSLMFMLFDLPANVWAAGDTSGSCGDNVTWSYDDSNKTLTISGSGAMTDYRLGDFTPWGRNYRKSIEKIIINDGVTHIGNSSFMRVRDYDNPDALDSVTSITIPSSVKTIGENAFNGCDSLTSVIIPYGVESIGDDAFRACKALKSITIPNSVQSIGEGAFDYCEALQSITIPEGVTVISGRTFYYCQSLTTVQIPSTVTAIGERAFCSCSSLTNITIPDGVTSIGDSAFWYCRSITNIDIPENVTYIGEDAFQNCSSLTEIKIPPKVTSLKSSPYANAFGNCTELKKVIFEGTDIVPELDGNVFSGCGFLTDNDDSTGIILPSCEYISKYLDTSGWDTYKDYILTKHTYDGLSSDGTKHWRMCSVCNDKTDEAVHTEDSGTITVQPTETTPGTKTFKCSVCGYVMRTETVPATGTEHVHDFGTDWKRDTVNHWHECVCGEKSDNAAHTEDSGTETVQPTETTEGTRTFKCTVCEYVMRTETIPATGAVPVPTPTPPSPPVTYPNPIVSPTVPADDDEPFIVDHRDIEGWKAISEDINITADGGIVDVDMNGTNILPKNIVEDIAGRDIDLVLEMSGGITWTINGMTVTDAQRTNMKVYVDKGRIPNDILETVSEGAYVKELTLKHTGEFGFTPVLTLKMPDRFEDKCANLFYYDPKSDEMEFVNFGMIRDGAVKLAFGHASEYAVVVSDVPMGGEDVSAAAGTSYNNSTISMVGSSAPKFGIIFITIIGASILALRKCKQK